MTGPMPGPTDRRPEASAATQLFRPYTGDFGAAGASGTDGVTELAEAHTSELPVVTDEAPSTALINGAPTVAHPGTDTADLGAPIDAPLMQDEPAAAVRPAEPETAGAGVAIGEGTTFPPRRAAPDPEVAPETVPEQAPETVSDAVLETETTDRPATGTRADLALLRTHPGLRARAAAAVLTPFVLYVIVLAVLGRFDQALLWVWIPIILAGVAFGLVLDLAQRARDRQRKDTPDSSAP